MPADDFADLFSEPQDLAPAPAPATFKRPPNKTRKNNNAAADITNSFAGMRVAAGAATGAAAPSQGGASKSRAGGIHSVPGSACTHSRAVTGAALVPGEETEVEGASRAPAPAVESYWPESQVSGDNRRKRKRSIVKNPVHQTAKLRRVMDAAGDNEKEMVLAPAPAAATQHSPAATKKRGGLRSARRLVAMEN